MKEFEYWKYDRSAEDFDSYLSIRKIDGETIHISVYNINIDGQKFNISHIPISCAALQASLKEVLKESNEFSLDDSFLEGFNNWKESKGGVWDIPLKKVIKNIKESLR